MDCLKDYIGIKYCGFAPSDSGEYINSYPGIEFSEVDQIANADQVSFAGVWADVQQRAIKKFRLDVIGRLSGFDSRYRLKQITQAVDLGIDITSGVTNAAVAKQRGLIIELKGATDQAICSNMQSIYVQSIKFYGVAAANYNIIVKDADYGTVLDTIAITGLVGWNSYKIDKQYDDVMRVSITVDTTTLDTASLDLSQFNLSNLYQSNWASNTYGWNNNSGLWFNYGCTGTAMVKGFQSDVLFTNPVLGVDTFGMSCVFSVRCTYNNIVCKNKRYFLNAWGYALCIELLTERIYSSRINKWTTVDLNRARELRAEFECMYRGGTTKDLISHEGELKKACDSIDLDLSDCCIECDAPLIWRESQL